MKKKKNPHKFLFLAGILLLVSCSSSDTWKLRLDLPGKPSVDVDSYDRILLTDFLVTTKIEEFDVGREIQGYLVEELKTSLKKPVDVRVVTAPSPEAFSDRKFWTALAPDLKRTLILTGSVDYSAEVRKALLDKERRQFEDPFPDAPRLAQRKYYSLNMHLFLIDSETGEARLDRNFKELSAYKNPNQTSLFALYDLVQKIKEKLVADLVGGTRVQERYLIAK